MSALDGTWLVVWIAVPMIADTCRAKPTMIMSPSFMRSTPSLPDEWSVPPDLGLTQPVGRKLIYYSRVTHTINKTIADSIPPGQAGLSLENGAWGTTPVPNRFRRSFPQTPPEELAIGPSQLGP